MQPGIRKCLKAMQALCVSVILAEHSFCENPRNMQCSNATESSTHGDFGEPPLSISLMIFMTTYKPRKWRSTVEVNLILIQDLDP